MLVCVAGLPGSGKTVFARAVAAALEERGRDVVRFSTDDVMQRLYPDAVEKEDVSHPDSDFSYEQLNVYYRAAGIVAAKIHEAEDPPILIIDGAFGKQEQRDQVIGDIDDFLVVKIECSPETCVSRVDTRVRGSKEAIEKDEERFELFERENVVVENEATKEKLEEKARRFVSRQI